MLVTVKITPAAIYYRGLSDKDCNDPLNDGIYSANPYEARNTHPPHNGNPIPEVRKLENGDACSLVEPVEWMWYWAWRTRIPSLPEATCKQYWERHMRDDAAFTNKAGSTTHRSFVIPKNTTKEPMRSEGVDCPGGNLYRAVDGKTVIKNGRECVAIWCLSYSYLKTLTVPQAKALAVTLPDWLLHYARIVHNDGSITNWDYDFMVPLMTSVGETEIVDGFMCRQNYLRKSRVVMDKYR